MGEPSSQVIERLKQQLSRGKISRRGFFRSLGILGVSLGASEILAACDLQPARTLYPTAYDPVFNDPTLIAVGKTMQANGEAAGLESPVIAEPLPYATVVPPKEITWLCESCGQQFLTVDALKTHAVEAHAKRLPQIQQVDQPTYSQYLVGEVERFDERNTALSRASWDPAYQAKIGESIAKATPPSVATLPGQALVAGAIYVDDTAGSLDPHYTGYMGHMKDTGGLYNWEDPINAERFPVSDPISMSEQIKDVASFYGADLVGITWVNPLWVYSHYFTSATGEHGPIEMPYTTAIVMGIEMNWQRIRKSPDFDASAATALAYSQMAELSASLAKFIRALGYHALPCGNDTALSIPLAIDAGLGELGRNGLLISPEYGPRQRLCKVFTDLPLQPDQPIDFGMASFCENCHACAGACPANAIPQKDRSVEPTSISNRSGILRWTVNVSDCLLFWMKNGGVDCSNCISACPWALRSTREWLEI